MCVYVCQYTYIHTLRHIPTPTPIPKTLSCIYKERERERGGLEYKRHLAFLNQRKYQDLREVDILNL